MAVSPAGWRPRFPLRGARGRARLQAGGEPRRRADGRIRRGAGAAGAARPAGPHDERAVRVAVRHQPDLRATRQPPGSATVGGTLATERDLGQRSIALGTNTDSYHRTFAEPLETVASEFVAGARPGPGQELHVVFAIPAPRLVPVAESGRVTYGLTFRLFVSDSSDSLVARLDTTRVFTAPQPLRAGAYP